MSISTNDLKNGMSLNLPEGLMTVVEFQHVKPGKGGAFVRTKLKNYKTGAVLDRTFRADEKVPLAVIDKREMQYLYREGQALVFMDSESYDQLHVEADAARRRRAVPQGRRLGGAPDLRGPGGRRRAAGRGRADGRRHRARACRATGCQVPRKSATLETGLVVQVPLFIEPGETVKVDTRSGEYLARA